MPKDTDKKKEYKKTPQERDLDRRDNPPPAPVQTINVRVDLHVHTHLPESLEKLLTGVAGPLVDAILKELAEKEEAARRVRERIDASLRV